MAILQQFTELFLHLVDIFLHLDQYLGMIIQSYGTLTYAILFGIVFAETGLVVMPFLPGDSLLFAAGAFAAEAAGGSDTATGASPASRRLVFFSTTTDLLRPWLKLWRTVPVGTDPATRGFRLSGARGPVWDGVAVGCWPSLVLSFSSVIRSLCKGRIEPP